MSESYLAAPIALVSSAQMGKIPVKHLKRYWSKAMLKRANAIEANSLPDEWQLDKTLLFTLCLGLEQTVKHLFQNVPDFDEFEEWIIETAGMPSQDSIDRFNLLFTDSSASRANVPQVLTGADLDLWNKHGYIIIRDAISKEDCEKSIKVICDFIDVDHADPATWYNQHPARQGIMVQLFQDAILEKNRRSIKIRQAFEQLWGRTDIWPTVDRVGFNPPETVTWRFPGPCLHWDVSLSLPIPFGLQGILYLADTAIDQGAFTLVPGFQHHIGKWIDGLPAGADPRKENLDALGSVSIAANAGDMIIWLQALPHGSSTNTSTKPRFVQYITYEPIVIETANEWI